MKRFLLISIGICLHLLFPACGRKDILTNFYKPGYDCHVSSYNAPFEGFKTFYYKEVNSVGYATSMVARITQMFGFCTQYSLRIHYLNPFLARITGGVGTEAYFDDEVT